MLIMTTMTMFGEVVETQQLTPRLRRIVLGGDGLAEFAPLEWTDQYINVRFVPPGAPYAVPFDLDAVKDRSPAHRPMPRRYTVRAWDPGTRRLTLDFVVHGDTGVAGRWATHARAGDRLQFTGPSGDYRPDPDADWHLLIGDESALPAIAASLEAIPAGRPALAVLVVDDADHELTLDSPGTLDVVWVHRASEPHNHDLLLQTVERLDFPAGRVRRVCARRGRRGAGRAPAPTGGPRRPQRGLVDLALLAPHLHRREVARGQAGLARRERGRRLGRCPSTSARCAPPRGQGHDGRSWAR